MALKMTLNMSISDEEETGESDGGPVLEANTDSDGDGSDGGLVLEANSA